MKPFASLPGRLAWTLFLYLFVVLPTAAFAQQEYSGRKVVSISYRPAKQPIDPRDLQKMQILEVGQHRGILPGTSHRKNGKAPRLRRAKIAAATRTAFCPPAARL